MRQSLWIIIVGIFFPGCFPPKRAQVTVRDKTAFIYTYIMEIDGKTIKDTFKMYISHVNEYLIYELPYHETKDINGKLVYDSLKYEFFIFNPEKTYGYSFKADSFSGIRLPKDSMLKKRAFGGMDLSVLETTYKIDNRKQIMQDNEMIDKFYVSDTLVDSIYCYYNSTKKGLNFSLSPKYDSLYNSKLYKMTVYYKRGIFSENGPGIPDGLQFEIKSIPQKNGMMVDTLLQRVEQKENY